MLGNNHGIEFDASTDINGKFEGFIPSADGQVCLKFKDGLTAAVQVKGGSLYGVRFAGTQADKTAVTGAAFY